jgi:hypothetical protein
MPRKHFKRTNSSRRRKKPSKIRRRPPASHLLIIECDPYKLAQQGLNLGTKVATLLITLFPAKRIRLVHASSLDDLKRALSTALEENDRFRTILIVGHSNETGLQLTPEQFFDWTAIGRWIAPFQPEFLLLAACQAGRSSAVQNIFDGVSSLKEIYASPVKFFSDQSHPFAGLLLALLKHRKVDKDLLRILQGAGYLLNDGVIYQWKRAEIRKNDPLTNLGWDLLGEIVNKRC